MDTLHYAGTVLYYCKSNNAKEYECLLLLRPGPRPGNLPVAV